MIKVLDKGYVKYVSHMGDDNSPLESARMSTGNETGVDIVKDDKLREYLWKNSHVSPFESCVLTVEMKLPLFVLRQLDRHRTLGIEETTIETYDTFRKYCSKNEFSGRYAEFADEFYMPSDERLKPQDLINKQASSDESLSKEVVEDIKALFISNEVSYEVYRGLVEKCKLSRELARLVLSGAIYTKIRITASLLNWFNFLRLRLDEHAQWEVRQYAKAVADIIKVWWPKSYILFEKHTLKSITLSDEEIAALGKSLNTILQSLDSRAKDYLSKELITHGLSLREAERLTSSLGIKDLSK